MKIPIFKLKFEKKLIKDFQINLTKILNSNSISDGSITRSFEKNFAKKNNSKFALAVSSGTSALEIAFEAINIENYEVIVPTNTFFGTILPIIKARGIIKLCDSRNNSPEISFEEIKSKVSKKTKAICVVHVGGIIHHEIMEIRNFCKKNKIYLVEDAAHAHFSQNKYNAGNFGDIGCFSFFPTKVMTTGEGGMIVTNNFLLYEKMKSLKNFGRSTDPLILKNIGSNSKISEFNSCLGLLELNRVDSRIKKRNDLVQFYHSNLSRDKFEVLLQNEGTSCYYKCIVRTSIPYLRIKNNLNKNGVSLTGKVWEIPIHKQNILLKNNLIKNINFKNAENFTKEHFCLPNYPELQFKEAEKICKLLNTL
jgi:dTDP-4-amino-4,6-dideoxygalactose transaminase